MTFFVHAEYSPNQSSLVLGWSFYNSKSFKPNKSDSLFGRKIEDF